MSVCQSSLSFRFLPRVGRTIEQHASRAFCGIYSEDGSQFLSATQGLLLVHERIMLCGCWVLFRAAEPNLSSTPTNCDADGNIGIYENIGTKMQRQRQLQMHDVGWAIVVCKSQSSSAYPSAQHVIPFIGHRLQPRPAFGHLFNVVAVRTPD